MQFTLFDNDILIETPSYSTDSIMCSNFSAVGAVRDYKVMLCDRKEIVSFVEHWHYSKNVNGLSSDYCFKLLDADNNMIGAMIYGKISMANVWKKYTKKESELIELKRLCCIDNTLKNTESYFIGYTLRWLKKNTEIKTVISYADTTYLHEGTIYKASNFVHFGMTAKGKVIMYNGKRYHDKTIRTKYKDNLKPFAIKIKEALKNGTAKYVETLGKHIYIYKLKKK
jgi:Fe-S cluster biosynthesis and repair protein YggX